MASINISMRCLKERAVTAGGFSVEGGFGADDMARYGSTMPITPGHVRRLVADGTKKGHGQTSES